MLICLLIAGILWREPQEPAGEDSLFVMFWNLENYFDWRSDTFDKKHWTRSKFLRKSQAIAKTILWLEDKNGILPDAIGVAEVENRKVLEILLKETPLRKRDYSIVHYDSPDPRGIDVALLYRKSRLNLLFSKPLKVTNKEGPEFSTRDILLSCFLRSDGDSVAFLVNHHPSKYGGPSSSWRRKAAMDRLEAATDSLRSSGFGNIVSMGDFNDTPESTSGYSRKMVNLAVPKAAKGEGTIKYEGKWELIDMFFVSPEIAARNPGLEMNVERVPFLMTRDNAHSGEKPLRTYTGPRYSGGVSDHCPITIVFK